MTAPIYPGSFDPVTLGHVDVMTRAVAALGRLCVAVVANPSKTPLLPADERVALIRGELARVGLDDVEVVAFDGLLVDLCTQRGATVVVKGLRGAADLDGELPMAQMNRAMSGVETLFVATAPEHSHLSSSLVREVARLGGPLDHAVGPAVAAALRAARATGGSAEPRR
ncbi:MAG: pantetheine-phosphate adenylyltransferase [Actinomycetota bacterium]